MALAFCHYAYIDIKNHSVHSFLVFFFNQSVRQNGQWYQHVLALCACSFNRGDMEGSNFKKLCMYVSFLCTDWFCGLTWEQLTQHHAENVKSHVSKTQSSVQSSSFLGSLSSSGVVLHVCKLVFVKPMLKKADFDPNIPETYSSNFTNKKLSAFLSVMSGTGCVKTTFFWTTIRQWS